MAQLKYSKQREMIKKYLYSTKEHPTAAMVYANVKKTFPNISLGTVYRNLRLLVNEGEIIRLDCGDGSERFDAKTEPHYHFCCSECKRVFDIEMASMNFINSLASRVFDGEICGHSICFYGKCSECKSKGESSH